MSDEPRANIYHLLPGVGVVIDDQVDDDGDPVRNLIAQLEQHDVPLVKYKQIPSREAIRALTNVAFILLDWELISGPTPSENSGEMAVMGGAALHDANRKSVIELIHALKASCFAPVFLFSNLDTTSIKQTLNDENLPQHPDPKAHIFVHAKADLRAEPSANESPLLRKLSDWITAHPALYMIGRWHARMNAAQTHLFWDLFAASPGWPKALWNASKDDDDNPDYAVCEILMRSLKAEMEPLGLDEQLVLGAGLPDPTSAELRAILERTTIVPADKLPEGQYGCGDLFRGTAQNGTPFYRLNIRCDCDCIAHHGYAADVELYLLKASIVSEEQLQQVAVYSPDTGFARPMNRAYVFPVDQGRCLAVQFATLITKTVEEALQGGLQRIGRLTSPHLTDIRHRYSNFLHREGFPKIPPLAVLGQPAAAPADAHD